MPKNAAPTASGADEDLVPVKLPSGGTFYVYARETKYFNDRVKRYMEDNHFTNVADLQVLDRVIMLELFTWRWGTWISQQTDYWFQPIDEKELSKSMKDTSVELRQLTQALGIDKLNRDKVKGEDSVSRYIENLKIRAGEFGVMRETQLGKALELFNELKAKVHLMDNTTPDEQAEMDREMPTSPDEVFAWIRDFAIPEYDKIDEHFRQNVQRFWIRNQ